MYTVPPSTDSAPTAGMSSGDIRQLCQLQIDRLGEKLPVLDVCLVCWNYLENKRDMLSYRRNHAALVHIQSYLDSERWNTENLPFLELKPLTLNTGESQAYVCSLGKTDDAHGDYLLLWTTQQISNFQRDLVKEYAQLLQQYLHLYQQNLRQREKIQLLEQALQRAEHQLRTPLSLIRLYAETIGLGAENDAQKQQADCIDRTAKKMLSNLSQCLSFGKQACLNRKNNDLLALLNNVVTLLQPGLKTKQLRVLHPVESVSLYVDGWQMEQVLQNLLDNAIYVSPVGGTITVNWQVSQQSVLITVSDQGPGLAGVSDEDLFTPFCSKRSGGTGLGLAIAKKIVLDHQGSIGAQPHPQGGAQFSIYLPR